MCREVDPRLRELLCYRENAFWANIRKKIKFFKPFGLDPPPPPLPRVTEQHPGYPLFCREVWVEWESININVNDFRQSLQVLVYGIPQKYGS